MVYVVCTSYTCDYLDLMHFFLRKETKHGLEKCPLFHRRIGIQCEKKRQNQNAIAVKSLFQQYHSKPCQNRKILLFFFTTDNSIPCYNHQFPSQFIFLHFLLQESQKFQSGSEYTRLKFRYQGWCKKERHSPRLCSRANVFPYLHRSCWGGSFRSPSTSDLGIQLQTRLKIFLIFLDCLFLEEICFQLFSTLNSKI